MHIDIIGVYPVEAPEPCHLVELMISDHKGPVDIADFTQAVPGQPRSNWQVPWDERVLELEGRSDLLGEFPDEICADGRLRLTFFFHYLNRSQPLLTPAGPVGLPGESQRPRRLGFLKYETP